MLISFTQTYGNRPLLIDIYSKDKRLIEFKNHFDLNIYSFHNVSNDIIEKFHKVNKVKNTKELFFYNIAYPQTIKILKKILKEEKCTYFFFSQDDTFSYDNNDIDFNEFIEFIKEYNENFLICLAKKNHYKHPIEPYIKNTFKLFKYSSLDLVNLGDWSFDDSPFICTADLLDTIYDENYFKLKDIYKGEHYLNDKFKNIKIPRYVTDKILFKNYNIFGKSIIKIENELMNLRKKNLI